MLILVMLLIAATSYNQTSRKPANNNQTAKKPAAGTTQTTSESKKRDDSKERVTQSRSSNQSRSTSYSDTKPAPQSRSNSTEVNRNRSSESTNRSANSDRSRSYEGSDNNRTESRSGSYDGNNSSTTVTRTRTQESSTTGSTTSRATTRTNPEYRSNSESRTVRNVTDNRSNSGAVQVHTNSYTSTRAHGVQYESPRVYRAQHPVRHHITTPPPSIEYRRVHHVYRRPVNIDIYWTPVIHRHFIEIYPMVNYWDYYNGYRIAMISAYDARFYFGDVMTVYGRVSEVFYNRSTDEYFLYFGPYYPYHDFTVVMPGYLARRYSNRPARYFANRDLAVTGLITAFNGEPEIVVKQSFQINLY